LKRRRFSKNRYDVKSISAGSLIERKSSMIDEIKSEDKVKEGLLQKINNNPLDDISHIELGNIYFRERDYEKAADHFRMAADIKPDEGIYNSNLGDVYRVLGNWAEAVGSYEKALEKMPGDDWVNNGLGIAYNELSEYEKAIEYYNKAIQIQANAAYYVNLGDVYRKIGNLDEAIEYYEEAIAYDDNYAPGYNSMGVTYYFQKDYEKAIENYQKALTLDPGNFVFFANLGDAYRGKQDWDQAIEAYNKALDIKPEDDICNNGIGVCYFCINKYDKAIEHYKKAISHASYPVYYINLADAYSAQQKWDEAICNYETAILTNADDDSLYYSLGIALKNKGKYHKALKQIQIAASLNQDPIYNATMGDIYDKLQNWDEGIKQYELAIERATYDCRMMQEFSKRLGYIYNDRGVASSKNGYKSKAINDYKKALELIPQDSVIFHNLFLAYKAEGYQKEAEENLIKAIELEPANQEYAEELNDLQPISV
jgi:tetratricopeptide (TPR) repeat protein